MELCFIILQRGNKFEIFFFILKSRLNKKSSSVSMTYLIGKTALKVLLYKSGRVREVPQVSDTCVEAMNDELHSKLKEVIHNACLLSDNAKRVRVTLQDVIEGAKLAGMGNFYGFTKGLSDSPIKCSTQNKKTRDSMKAVNSRLETKIKKYGQEEGCVDVNMTNVKRWSREYSEEVRHLEHRSIRRNYIGKAFTADAMHMIGFLMQIHMSRVFSAACILCLSRKGVRVFGRDIKNSIAICETLRGRM